MIRLYKISVKRITETSISSEQNQSKAEKRTENWSKVSQWLFQVSKSGQKALLPEQNQLFRTILFHIRSIILDGGCILHRTKFSHSKLAYLCNWNIICHVKGYETHLSHLFNGKILKKFVWPCLSCFFVVTLHMRTYVIFWFLDTSKFRIFLQSCKKYVLFFLHN